MRLQHLPVSVKLIVAFAVLLAISLGSGYGSFKMIQATGSALNTAVDTTAKKVILAGHLRDNVRDMRLHAALAEISRLNSSVMGSVTAQGKQMVCADCHTPDKITSNRAAFDSIAVKSQEHVVALLRLDTSQQERATVTQVGELLSDWQRLYAKYFDAASRRNFANAHETMLDEIYPLADSIEKSANSLIDEEEKAMVAAGVEANDRVRSSAWRASGGVILCLLAGLGGLTLVRQITRVLRLSAAEMIEMTREAAGAASQIAEAAASLAATASQQSSSLEVSCASAEEIRSAADRNTERVQTVSAVTQRVQHQFERANQLLDQSLQSMAEINNSGKEIAKIATAIDDIAFQTNILALNAAIEAARAGSAGSAFGVVADDVRALAQRSAVAARNTSEMIQSAIATSSQGAARLQNLAHAIEGVTHDSQAIGSDIGEITGASERQRRSVEDMTHALAEMESVTQRVSACSEENAAAGEQLTAQTRSLSAVAERLRTLVG